jgi:hypothetical protein
MSGSKKEVFTVANKIFRRRTLVLLALVALAIVAAKAGGPGHGLGLGHNGFGMWDGPLP